MRSESTYLFTLAVLLISSGAQSAAQARQKAEDLALDKLELHNVKAEPVTYLGRRALRVTDAGPHRLWMTLADSLSLREAPFRMAPSK